MNIKCQVSKIGRFLGQIPNPDTRFLKMIRGAALVGLFIAIEQILIFLISMAIPDGDSFATTLLHWLDRVSLIAIGIYYCRYLATEVFCRSRID